MFKKKRVLITGAAGFIGANLTKKLVDLGAEVHLLIKKPSNKWRIKNFLHQTKEHNSNLSDEKQLKRIISRIKPQIIYHLAAHGSHPFQTNRNEIIKTNITGIVNLLNALSGTNYQSFVNTGTSSEYGLKNKPMKESDLLEPITFYAATKVSTTLLCQVFAKMNNKPIVTLRLFSVFGYYEPLSRLIAAAIKSCLTGKTLKLTSGEQKHDFIFIEDVIDAYLKVPFIKNISGEIINIGSGKQYSNEEVIHKISKLCQKKLKIKKGAYPPRYWDTNYWVADNSKAKKLLGWKPKHTFDQGLQKTIDWFQKNLQYYE